MKVFLPAHINMGLTFAAPPLATSGKFKYKDEVKIKEILLKYDGEKMTFVK